MAQNENVQSVHFGAQALGEPKSYRLAARGTTVDDAAGVDAYASGNHLVRRNVEIEVNFKDWDDAKTLVTTDWGSEDTLTIVTRALASAATKTLTIANARLRDVIIDAVHSSPGTHIAVFVARSTDGATNPVT